MSKSASGEAGRIDETMAEGFLASLRVSPVSVQTYKRNIRNFFVWLRERGLDRPTKEDILAYRGELEAAGRSGGTVQAYLTTVRLFFRWAGEAGLYPDVARGIKTPPKAEPVHRDALTLPQVERVLSGIDRGSVQGLRDYAMVALMASGGLGCQELSRAKVGDFRPSRTCSTLRVPSRKRNGEIRLDGSVELALREYLEARELVTGPLPESAPLFLSISNNNRGGSLSSRAVGRIVKDALKGAGCEGQLTAHSLKQTAGLLALIEAMQGKRPAQRPIPRLTRRYAPSLFLAQE